MAVSKLIRGESDGYINSSNNTYLTARSGSNLGALGADSLIQVGQITPDTLTYRITEGFARFDLSTIPTGAIISAAVISVYGATGGDGSVTNFTLEAYLNDAGTLTSADWVPGASIGALTLLASAPTLGWTTGAYTDLTNAGSALATAIAANAGGYLGILLSSDRERLATVPTTMEYVFLESSRETSPANSGPKLTITYTTALQVSTNTAGGYASGQLLTKDRSAAWAAGTGDMYFKVNTNTNSTQVAYNSYDPGAIMRSIMDKYIAQGGNLGYDTSTIELTGTTVSYTFNTNTTLEGVKKVLELAPAGWYFYIDQATNMLHFHNKASVATRRFILGRDLIELKPEKRTEDIVNIIYFTGGGTPALFTKYTRAGSVGLYGNRAARYVDQRVTVAATAATIAGALLDQRQAPELRLSFEVVDTMVDSSIGYDLETITIGDTVGLRNTGGVGSSLWDVAQWDVDYWDFNIKDISTAILQIVRMEKSPESAKIYCSTVPPDVSKRIEDINRNLEASQTANNPSVAS